MRGMRRARVTFTREERLTWESSLRVLVVHSRYARAQPSGENNAVDQHVAALERMNMSVRLVEQRTDDRKQQRLYPLTAGLTVASGRGPHPLDVVRAFQPDIVHVHNLFPNYGREWVTRLDVPLVATLHNYRPLCPAGTFFRDGHACTDCLDRRSPRPSVQHACYRGSRLQTLPLAAGLRFDHDPVLRNADRLIVLTDTMRGLYERAGVPAERMTTLPNFLPDTDVPPIGPGGDHWLYVGRLSPEKGIAPLVEQWPAGHELLVVGGGPDEARVARAERSGVRLLGQQPPEVVRRLMATARGLVFPSRWFEGSPLTYIEALAAGTPVLAWEPSSVAADVRQDGTGLVANGDLGELLSAATVTFAELRRHCRGVFDTRYTEAAWVRRIDDLYHAVVENPARLRSTVAGRRTAGPGRRCP
jgi:glycosyltransferase involved in cell wall biosynthesis